MGYYNSDYKYYKRNNKDLLSNGVDEKTHNYLIDVFSKLLVMRNEFFHRDNLLNWNKVNEVRNQIRLALYLFLWAYSFSRNELIDMGLVNSIEKDDYYLLCEYMHKTAMNHDHKEMDDSSDSAVFPIYYVDDDKDSEEFYLVKPDPYIEFDEYGEPVYSAFYFGFLGDKRPYKV